VGEAGADADVEALTVVDVDVFVSLARHWRTISGSFANSCSISQNSGPMTMSSPTPPNLISKLGLELITDTAASTSSLANSSLPSFATATADEDTVATDDDDDALSGRTTAMRAPAAPASGTAAVACFGTELPCWSLQILRPPAALRSEKTRRVDIAANNKGLVMYALLFI